MVANDFVRDYREPVLILSDRTILTDQTIGRANLRIPGTGIGRLQAGRYPTITDYIIVGTAQTAREERHLNLMVKRTGKPGLIIIDEMHKGINESFDKVIDYFPKAKILGVTATPYKENKLITHLFDKITYSISMQDLIDKGYLVPPVLNVINRYGNDLDLIIAQCMAIVKNKCEGKSTLIYMQNVEDVKLMRNVFRTNNIKAEAVTYETPDKRRQEIFEKFDRGDTHVLINVDVLSTGFDCPRVESIIMPYKTESVVLYLQRIGRGLRCCPRIGKTNCQLYLFGDSPSISRELYEKTERGLNIGRTEVKKYDTLTETLELNDYTNIKQEVFEWTKKTVEVIQSCKKLGLQSLGELLDQRQFPRRFMQNVLDLQSSLPKSKVAKSQQLRLISPRQKALLQSLGFKKKIDRLSKQEATILISKLIPQSGNQKHVLKEGNFKGQHISQVPWAYKQRVLKGMPNSPVAQQIRDYYATIKKK